MSIVSKAARGGKFDLLHLIAGAAIIMSVALAGFGVAGEYGFGAGLFASLGAGFLLALTLLTEVAAARLLLATEAHIGARTAGGYGKAAAALGVFAVLTAWNLFAGHLGAQAIDRAGVADRRAPLEQGLADAGAALLAAEDDLAAFDAAEQRRAETLAGGLRGAFAAGYVTAASRSLRTMGDDGAAASRRAALSAALRDARADHARAEAAMAHAPSGRAEHELWIVALVLELLKGALVWLARPRQAQGQGHTLDVACANLAALNAAARAALKSRCASILATLRHIEQAERTAASKPGGVKGRTPSLRWRFEPMRMAAQRVLA